MFQAFLISFVDFSNFTSLRSEIFKSLQFENRLKNEVNIIFAGGDDFILFIN